MMPTLLLAIALIAQSRDPVFCRVVEDWVIDRRDPGTGLALALGPRRAAIVRTLGNDRYDARRIALELLMAEPPVWRRRMLLWGMRARDVEVRAVCRRVWDEAE